jgi:tetratricopeptide (TPR) repeat protein
MKRLLLAVCALAIAAPVLPTAYAVESASAARERRQAASQKALKDGLDALGKEDYDKAITLLTEALDGRGLTAENKVIALYGRGLAHFNKKDCPSTMKDFDQLQTEKASDPQYHYIRSVCLAEAGDKPGADAALDKAVELSPDKPDFIRIRCINRTNAKDYANAIADCEKYLALKGDDADVWLAVGQMAEVQKLNDKARAAYQRVLQLKPDSAPAKDGLKRIGG